MMNQVLEATLVFMILLLALSVSAIVRVGPMPQAQAETNLEGDMSSIGNAFPPGIPDMPAGQAGMLAGQAGMVAGPAGPAAVVAAPQPGRTMQAPPGAMWPSPAPGGFGSGMAAPPPRRSGFLGRGRYEARHVRGRMPRPRPPAPAGPPWGPATPPPSRPQQQGSERWT